ncbi:hypothetical protein FSP39_006495 [Pinctada imbricata]|uniref:Transforming acidic coiled-coil-containing protein C-terminal domain-containing protein n=1 Tax=Pinctada imbricata TaxID=66713 RepID=A0AA88XZ41_PINIB|nr:hypothetical protein FSP39_006495 [Pinctada imbricata]
METNLMDFSMDQDENADPNDSDYKPPALLQTPQIVNSILKKSCKDNLIQLYTPVHKPGLKVQFQTPHSTVKKSTPTRFDAVRKLDEKERWIERTSVVTKQDHLDYVMYATEIFNELINNLPIDRKENEAGIPPDSPDNAIQDTTLCNDMDVSMTVDDRVTENITQSNSNADSTESSDSNTGGSDTQTEIKQDTQTEIKQDTQTEIKQDTQTDVVSGTQEEEDMDTDDFFDAVDTPDNVLMAKENNVTVLAVTNDDTIQQCKDSVLAVTNDDTIQQCKDSVQPSNDTVDQETIRPPSPPLPAKGGYNIDFDNLDDFNPFQTKSAVANSPCGSNKESIAAENPNTQDDVRDGGQIKCDSEVQEDNGILSVQSPDNKRHSLSQLQKVSDNPFLKLIDSPIVKPQDPAEKQKVLDEMMKSADDDILSQSFEDIDPFKPKKQIVNSPDKEEKSLTQCTAVQVNDQVQDSPPAHDVNVEDQTTSSQHAESDDGNITVIDTKDGEDLSSVITAADESFTKSISATDSLPVHKANSPAVKEDENPFACKKQLANSPSVNDEENPFTCKKQLANSPLVKDEENPFTCKKQLANSPLVKEDENPFACKKQLANSPLVKEEENPFTCKKQSANSPLVKEEENPFACKKQLANSPLVKDEENPFACKNQIANSSLVKDEQNPFTCKTQLANSPFVKDKENPFTCKMQLANSPVVESTDNPLKASNQIPYSPIVNSAGKSEVPSNCSQPKDDAVDVLDPFKSSNKMVNSPCTNSNQSELDNDKQTSHITTQHQNVLDLTPARMENKPKDKLTASDPFDTPKFKSVEGGIPETTVSKNKGSLPENTMFTSPSQLGLSEEDFKSNTNDYFWDPSALDMLEKFGNTQNGTESNYSRMSLFQAFDPLVDLPQNDPRRISLAARRASIREAKRNTLGGHRMTGFKGRESSFPEESICLFGTPTRQLQMMGVQTARNKDGTPNTRTPNRDKQVPKGTTPKKTFVDLLTDTPDNKSVPQLPMDLGQDDQTEDLLEIVQYTEADMRGLKQRLGLEFQGILLQKEKEMQQRENQLKKEIEQVNKKLEASKEENVTVTKNLKGMVETVNEYESIINEITKREEKLSAELKESRVQMQKEKDQSNEDIQNMDKAFSDLHKRFEKTKEILQQARQVCIVVQVVLLQARQNEAKWRQYGEECATRLKKSEEKAAKIKEKAEEKLNELAEKMEKMKVSSESEINMLQATLKRKDMTVDALQKQVEQKTTENKELTELCDQLFAKFGGGK